LAYGIIINAKILYLIMTGYSGTPLAKKLGIKAGFKTSLINAPEYYCELFIDMPGNLLFDEAGKKDFIHFFVKSKDEYLSQLPLLKQQLKADGMLWASWPKKSSKVITDITEDIIRNYAIQIGLVDIKVCAIDEIWSGLKLVIPLKDRRFSG
jgi:hypothetical protein